MGSAGAATPRLQHEGERRLLVRLGLVPGGGEQVALEREPHRLTHYAQELAQAFHVFCTQCHVVDRKNEPLSRARLLLLDATRAVLARTLGLMGVSAPDRM